MTLPKVQVIVQLGEEVKRDGRPIVGDGGGRA